MNEQTAIAGDGGKGTKAIASVRSRGIVAGFTAVMLALVTGPALGQGFDLDTEAENTDALLVETFDGTPLDLNGDTFVDLVVGNVAVDSRIYFGNGDGTFTEAANILSTGLSTRDLDAGDVDGDGILDIVQANNGQTNNLYLGLGGGMFGAAIAIGPEIEATASIELAHMNGDMLLDVVVGNTSTNQVNRVYPNTTAAAGSPTFGAPVDISAETDVTRHLEVGDLDGDGDLDVVAANDNRGGAAGDTPSKYYVNTLETGTFGFAAGVDLAQVPLQSVDDMELTDLDNDNDLDLVVVSFTAVNRFFLNQADTGTLSFDGGADISVDNNHSNAVSVIDVDGDGDPDVLVGNGDTTGGAGGTAEVNRLYLNQFVESGTVSFDAGQNITDDLFVTREIASIDINGDGNPDLITGERNQRNRVYLGNGTATPFVNVPPEFTSTPVTDATVDMVYTYDVTAEDPDAEDAGEALTITDDGNLPAWLTLTDNGDGTATLTGTPAVTDVGDVDVTLTVTNTVDSTSSDQMFTITVSAEPVGEAPAFTSTPVTNATEGVAYSYDITATDADMDALTITAVGPLPGWLVLTDNGDGTATLTGTPDAADVGDHIVSLQVSDGTLTDTQVFTINVAAAGSTNTPPEFTSTPVTDATVDEAYTYAVTTEDAEGDTLTIEAAATLPAWLTLTDNGDGTATLSGTPAAGDVGTHDVSLQVSDGTAAPVLQNFVITVDEAAAPPPPPPGPTPTPPRRDGGGGALGFWSFLAMIGMSGVAVRRRRGR